MPFQEQSHRTQHALLWPRSGDDAYGEPTVSSVVQLRVRWNDTRAQASDAQGNPVTLSAEVHVDRNIKPGSVMWLGTLAEWLGTGSNQDDTEVMEVVSYNSVNDLKGRVAHHSVSLARYRGTLPTLT